MNTLESMKSAYINGTVSIMEFGNHKLWTIDYIFDLIINQVQIKNSFKVRLKLTQFCSRL